MTPEEWRLTCALLACAKEDFRAADGHLEQMTPDQLDAAASAGRDLMTLAQSIQRQRTSKGAS